MAKSKAKSTAAIEQNSEIETALQGEDYYQMVSEAAYYKAEKRNFESGYEMEDWVAAETEIQALQKEMDVA